MSREGAGRRVTGAQPDLKAPGLWKTDCGDRREDGDHSLLHPGSMRPKFWCPASPFVPCGISGKTSHHLILSLFITAWAHYKGQTSFGIFQ